MQKLYKVSLLLNVLVLLAILYVGINGKNIAKNFFTKNIISVRHDQKLTSFKSCPAKKDAIIFLGNSITEGGNWSELFENANILNRGIGGDITQGVLDRLDEITRHKPSKVFICIGTNDLAMDIENETILANYLQIIKTIQEESPNTKIYVQSVLPVGKNVLFTHSNEKIIPFNVELEKLCAENNVPFINLYPSFLGADGNLNSELTNDNLHLLGVGYELWKDLILEFVNE